MTAQQAIHLCLISPNAGMLKRMSASNYLLPKARHTSLGGSQTHLRVGTLAYQRYEQRCIVIL